MTEFADLLAVVTTASGGRFGHREHVRLTWLAIRRHGPYDAERIVSDGIRTTAAHAGHPQKYHHTVSCAWTRLIAHHAEHDPSADFGQFARRNPELLDKRLLSRFYESRTLAGGAARSSWVEPDRPFPWMPPLVD